MKQLLLGVLVLVLLGVGGFMYRNALEAPDGGDEVACTMEAKLCPDGSAVGRQGPLCEFAPCPLPNAEDADIGLSFVIPSGYVSNPDPIGADESLRVVLDTPAPGGIPHSIIIRRYPIPAGETAEDVILAHTFRETSGMQVESIDEFDEMTIGGRAYKVITVERFEAIVHTLFYLPRTDDVLRFEVLERDVTEWTNPSLVVTDLSEHQALIGLLGSAQIR